MMELIEKFGSLPGYSIFKILGVAVDTLSVPDIIENSYEYKDDDEYTSLWQDQSTKELDRFYDELVDELDGEFDDMRSGIRNARRSIYSLKTGATEELFKLIRQLAEEHRATTLRGDDRGEFGQIQTLAPSPCK